MRRRFPLHFNLHQSSAAHFNQINLMVQLSNSNVGSDRIRFANEAVNPSADRIQVPMPSKTWKPPGRGLLLICLALISYHVNFILAFLLEIGNYQIWALFASSNPETSTTVAQLLNVLRLTVLGRHKHKFLYSKAFLISYLSACSVCLFVSFLQCAGLSSVRVGQTKMLHPPNAYMVVVSDTGVLRSLLHELLTERREPARGEAKSESRTKVFLVNFCLTIGNFLLTSFERFISNKHFQLNDGSFRFFLLFLRRRRRRILRLRKLSLLLRFGIQSAFYSSRTWRGAGRTAKSEIFTGFYGSLLFAMKSRDEKASLTSLN